MIGRLLLCLLLSGCASDRYLSAGEDANMRAACEAKGCAIVPLDVWRQVEKLLGFTDI